jgi:hypothetical protein
MSVSFFHQQPRKDQSGCFPYNWCSAALWRKTLYQGSRKNGTKKKNHNSESGNAGFIIP